MESNVRVSVMAVTISSIGLVLDELHEALALEIRTVSWKPLINCIIAVLINSFFYCHLGICKYMLFKLRLNTRNYEC